MPKRRVDQFDQQRRGRASLPYYLRAGCFLASARSRSRLRSYAEREARTTAAMAQQHAAARPSKRRADRLRRMPERTEIIVRNILKSLLLNHFPSAFARA